MKNINHIAAIVITFQPCLKVLQRQIDSLEGQVDSIVMVDNFSNLDCLIRLREMANNSANLKLIELSDNFGIAKAQNEGILYAKSQGANFVLILDQDSYLEEDVVSTLLGSYEKLTSLGAKVCAIGPRFIDDDSGHVSQHVRFGWLSVARIKCQAHLNEVPVDFLISSGSLIPISVLDKVGLMDEDLFIDHVDTEWVLRAKSLGYEAYGDCHALMHHSLGEHRIRFWFGRWRDIPIHKPFRYYYIFRNSILLRKRPYMGSQWKWVDLIRLFQITIFMGIVANERRKKIKMIFKGIVAGFRDDIGRLPDK